MIKFFIKIVALTFILLIVFRGLDFIYKDFYFFEKTIKEYKTYPKNIDIAILGNSHAHQSYDVRIIESKLGLSSFNFGNSAQNLETTKVILNNIIKEHNLKLIILDVLKMNIKEIDNENNKKLQLKTLDHLPITFKRVEQTNYIFGVSETPYALSPFLRNHYDFNKITRLNYTREYKIGNKNEFYMGFKVPTRSFGDKVWKKFTKKFKKKSPTNNFKDISSKEKKRILYFIEVAEENNIPILFVNSPTYVNDYYKEYKKTTSFTKRYVEALGKNFLDFDYLRKNKTLTKEDFADPNHLNTLGAIKVTDSLVNFIKNTYSFKIEQKPNFLKNKYFLFFESFSSPSLKPTKKSTKELKAIKNKNLQSHQP